MVHFSSAVALVQCTFPVLLHLPSAAVHFFCAVALLFSAVVHFPSAVALVQCDALCQCCDALLSVLMLHPCTVPVLSWCDTDLDLMGSRLKDSILYYSVELDKI